MSKLIKQHTNSISFTNFIGINDLKCNGCEEDLHNQLGHVDDYSIYGCLTLSDHVFCTMLINVKHYLYTHENNTEYFYIDYTYKYGDYQDESLKCNPFLYPSTTYKDFSDGSIIFKNEISQILIDMLITNSSSSDSLEELFNNNVTQLISTIEKYIKYDNKTLELYSGHVDIECYREQLNNINLSFKSIDYDNFYHTLLINIALLRA